MEQIAFRMRLKPGREAEYRARHDAIWPELAALLRDSGVRDYSIFLDQETHALFAVLRRTPEHRMDSLPQQAVMRRWWEHMRDIMETEPDGVPQVVPLAPMFHLD
ncbi:MAG TPA: L-rhamnose mutarotase [Acetobacteraceae bacterium]|nr:L-rhamnose mutarotase [Acetobacteraceae bacterium]